MFTTPWQIYTTSCRCWWKPTGENRIATKRSHYITSFRRDVPWRAVLHVPLSRRRIFRLCVSPVTPGFQTWQDMAKHGKTWQDCPLSNTENSLSSKAVIAASRGTRRRRVEVWWTMISFSSLPLLDKRLPPSSSSDRAHFVVFTVKLPPWRKG
jgi:hypothetical protein